MRFFKQIKLKRIREFCQKAPRLTAEHAFLTFWVLFFISLIIGGLLFYRYGILSQKIKPEIEDKAVKFREDLYQKVLSEWQERAEKFEGAQTKKYPDPFKP